MKYSREKVIEWYESNLRPRFLFFYGVKTDFDQVGKECLSQWYECDFTVDGIRYHTAEQYMMAQKALLFNDKKSFYKIMAADSPREYKAIGRKIKGFNQDVWDEHKYDIVYEGNYAKFSQNKVLGRFLEHTGDTVLVEASPFDEILGIKMSDDNPDIYNPEKWNGQNLLGFVLMDVRDSFFNILSDETKNILFERIDRDYMEFKADMLLKEKSEIYDSAYKIYIIEWVYGILRWGTELTFFETYAVINYKGNIFEKIYSEWVEGDEQDLCGNMISIIQSIG